MNNTNRTQLIEKMLRSLGQNKPEQTILDFTFKKSKETENELLFFFKPECFFGGNPMHIKAILEMVFEKFIEFKVDITGILLLDGKRLEELSIMDRHYGFINKISKEASKIVSQVDLKKIQLALGINDLKNYKVLGGHEVLRKYPEFNEKSLDEFWQTKKSMKLRSGFYVQQYVIKEQPIIMINGFHPSQLRHYTNPLHKIILILLNSDTEWKILKNDLAGDTFPERAKGHSIRGEIFANHQKYGIQNISISNNCVHLSAGPFEALFEIDNFLSHIKDLGFNLNKTNIARLMKKNGCEKEEIKCCLLNPKIQIDGVPTDLFTFTEEKNSNEVISLYREYFLKR